MRSSLVALLLSAAACTAEEPRILAVAQLGDTRDTAGPYPVTVVASGVSDGDEVEVYYYTAGQEPPGADAGGVQAATVKAQEGARSDLFVAGIPGHPAGSEIFYGALTKRDGAVVMFPTDIPWHFRVLAPSGFCRADSDCQLGLEICADETCRAYQGTCVATPSGLACPGGYVCDAERDPDLCVIAPHPCANDSHCPSAEECDLSRDECVARVPCDDPTDCTGGYICNENLGLCFRD